MAETRSLVVVLTWNGREDTLRCVASLRDGAAGHDVLVVDNGSHDGALDAVSAAWPGVGTLQTGENLGFAGGMNRGVAWGLRHGYDVVTVLNNDTVVEPGALDRLVARATGTRTALSPRIVRDGDAGALWFAGGVLDAADGLPRHLTAAEVAASGPAPGPVVPTDLLTGCCIVADAAVWRDVGPFDERYFLNFEDSDWSLRAVRRGVGLLVDHDAVVRHRVSASFVGPAAYLGTFYYARNALLFARTWRDQGVRGWPILRRHVLPGVTEAWRTQGVVEGLRRGATVLAALVARAVRAGGRAPRGLERAAARWARSPG